MITQLQTGAGAYHRDVATIAGTSFSDLVNSRKIIDFYASQGRLSNMKLLWDSAMGRTIDTNAPADTFSKAFSADDLRNNLTQTTKALQPFRLGHIQGVAERLYNPSGSSDYMSHPAVTFTDSQPWTLSLVVNYNGTAAAGAYFAGLKAGSGFLNVTGTGNCFSIREQTSPFTVRNGAAGGTLSLLGKVNVVHFVADGAGNISIYKNGVFFETIVALSGATFDNLFNAYTSTAFSLKGSVYHYSIESGAATATQIAEEHTLLRSYYPEIPSVTIVSQTWAVDNFRAVVTPIGTVIPEVTDNAAWAALTTPAWCSYNNDPTNDAIYGKLYNWYAIRKFQDDIDTYNAANPTNRWGWHFPTSTEFNTLITNLGGTAVAGGKMKLTGTNYWSSPNTGATNESGLCLLGGGRRYFTGVFSSNLNSSGTIWSLNAYIMYIQYNSNSAEIYDYSSTLYKIFGFSARLIKD